MASITFVQGDTINSTILITDSDDEIVNLTGGTVKFRIVTDPHIDVKASAVYNNDAVTISDATAGEATLTITRTVTKAWTAGIYKWELEYIDSATNYSHTGFDQCIIEKSIYSEDT